MSNLQSKWPPFQKNLVCQNIFKQNYTLPTQSRKRRTSLLFYGRINNYLKELNIKIQTTAKRPIHSIPPWNIPKIEVNISLLEHNNKKTNYIILKSLFQEMQHNKLLTQLYTDDSKTPSSCEYAVVSGQAIQKVKLH